MASHTKIATNSLAIWSKNTKLGFAIFPDVDLFTSWKTWHSTPCSTLYTKGHVREISKIHEVKGRGGGGGVICVCKKKAKKSLKRTAWFIVLLPYTFLYIMYAVCARIHVPIFISEVNDRIWIKWIFILPILIFPKSKLHYKDDIRDKLIN